MVIRSGSCRNWVGSRTCAQAPETGHHLVGDEQDVVLSRQRPGSRPVALGGGHATITAVPEQRLGRCKERMFPALAGLRSSSSKLPARRKRLKPPRAWSDPGAVEIRRLRVSGIGGTAQRSIMNSSSPCRLPLITPDREAAPARIIFFFSGAQSMFVVVNQNQLRFGLGCTELGARRNRTGLNACRCAVDDSSIRQRNRPPAA